MCILFIYNGSKDAASDYTLIMISNRDEYYDRPSQTMAQWEEDPNVIGGRDLEARGEKGTWLAISPQRRKMGVLLNLPGNLKENAKSRGRIVADYVKNGNTIEEYVEDIKKYAKECNDFVFVSIEFGSIKPSIYTYTNVTNDLTKFTDSYMGFGNSFPHEPLKKALAGKQQLKDICDRYNKVQMKENLIEELINLLKSNERHLPDLQLETKRPNVYQQLSSICVTAPECRYGTRTHTVMLVNKSGHIDLIELTMLAPIDPLNPKWERTEFKFDIQFGNKL